ncbi:uncharacterized protein LOC117332182 [Pecten maximus]|uniref:uncharacterized protein LOC117332182 n=1 Tax=Pecten maximus TaxID=6579 RepID=UPI001458A2A7|nr:uncharacterized protein LOC117332182 [Pecten maximus]
MTSSTSSIDDLLDLDFGTPVAADAGDNDQRSPGAIEVVGRSEPSHTSNTLLLDFGASTTESSTDDNLQSTKDGDFCLFAMDDVTGQGFNTLTTDKSAITPTSPWQPLDVLPGQVDLTPSRQSKSSVGSLNDEDALLFDPLAPMSPFEPTQETSDSEPTLKKWTVTSGPDSDTVQPVGRPDLLDFAKDTRTSKKEDDMADPKRGKMNRTMERSFEDLLAGLEEDDLDPDLDDILTTGSLSPQITDASFNAMAAQSKKSYTQFEDRLGRTKDKEDDLKEDDSKESEPPQKLEDQKTIDEIFGEVEESRASVTDLLTSDEEEPPLDVEGVLDEEPEANVEVMVTDHDEPDAETRDVDEKEAVLSDMDDSTAENGQLKREASLDFNDVGDTSHLDVNIGKQKTSLRKKGSLARRRKPTRTNVRNILSSSEDSHFQDTTEAKESSSKEINGFGDEEVFDKSGSPDPTSPPAKKSSHLMMPLPGLGQPMLPRKTPQPRASPDEEMTPVERKRDPKAMGVKLPMPQLRPTRTPDNQDQEKAVSPEFEKPALRKVTTPQETENVVEKNDTFEVPTLKAVAPEKPARQSEKVDETEKLFSKPPLKSVPKMEVDTTPVSVSKETPYNIPLRRVDSNREKSPVKPAKESENIFDTPSLKRVQRDDDADRSKISPENEGKFEVPALKTVASDLKRSESQEIESEKTFNKPALRNTPKVKAEPPTSAEAKGKFDLPSLKRTPKVPRSDSSELNSGGAFDVPNLKNNRPVKTQLEFDDVAKGPSENKHTFDVPQLKNTPKSDIEGSKEAAAKDSKEEPSWMKDMKLRKTSTKSEESLDQMKEKETPVWMKTAAEKREKAAEILNTKENQSKTPGDGKPQWTDMSRLRKTPNGLPLQESTESSENSLNGKPSQERIRLASTGSKDGDSSSSSSSRERTPVSGGTRDQYVPSWLKTKDNRHQSTPNLNVISPPSADTTSIPQWKKDLAERRKLRKENSVDTPLKVKTQLEFDDVAKGPSENKHTFDVPQLKNTPKSDIEGSKEAAAKDSKEEPSWMKDMKLRKTSTKSEESLDQMKEKETPVWMKTAAEKREKAAEILNTKENQSKTPGDGKPQWTDMSRLRKTPNGLPLQESTESSENSLNGKPSQERVRLASTGSKDGDSSSSSSSRERTPVSGGTRDQYVPSWLKTKDNRHQSTPNLNVISPPSADTTSIPQWKKDLAERRKLRKENSVDTPLKAKSDSTDAGAASWKTEFALKKKTTPMPKTTAEIRTSSY